MKLYDILGVSQTATLEEIKKAFRRKALTCHPDKVGTQSTELFQKLNNAYKVLSSPELRKQYDETGIVPDSPLEGDKTKDPSTYSDVGNDNSSDDDAFEDPFFDMFFESQGSMAGLFGLSSFFFDMFDPEPWPSARGSSRKARPHAQMKAHRKLSSALRHKFRAFQKQAKTL